jgi:hypothetical protein
MERVRRNRHAHPESASGLTLALRAMACIEQQWKRIDPVTNGTAEAATG